MNLLQKIKFEFHARRLARLRARWQAKHWDERRRIVRDIINGPAFDRGHVIDVPAIARQQFGSGSAFNNAHKSLNAFSLIELMIVVGIIGILVALAIPAYAGYSTKAAASEATQLAAGAELAMIDTFQESSNWPLSNAASGYTPQTGKYAGAVVDGNGNVAITFTQNAPAPLVGTVLMMQAYLGPDNQTVLFQCGTAPVPLFNGVAGTLLGAGGPVSTVPVQYLPKTCRP